MIFRGNTQSNKTWLLNSFYMFSVASCSPSVCWWNMVNSDIIAPFGRHIPSLIPLLPSVRISVSIYGEEIFHGNALGCHPGIIHLVRNLTKSSDWERSGKKKIYFHAEMQSWPTMPEVTAINVSMVICFVIRYDAVTSECRRLGIVCEYWIIYIFRIFSRSVWLSDYHTEFEYVGGKMTDI